VAIAHVQHTGSATGNSASAQSKAFASNVTAHSALVVAVCTYNSRTITVTVSDDINGSYTQAGAYIANGAGSHVVSIWYFLNSAAGGAPTAGTVTVTPSVSAFVTFGIHEYSGVLTAAALDGNNSGTGTSTAGLTGSVTVSGAGELLFAALGADTNATQTYTPDSGPPAANARYSQTSSSLAQLFTEDYITVSASQAAAATLVSDKWSMLGISLKPAVGAAGGLFLQTPMTGLGIGGPFFSNPIGKWEDRRFPGFRKHRRRKGFVELGVG
jgi:hypothetical protein